MASFEKKLTQNLVTFLSYFQNMTLTSSKLTIFLIFTKHDANDIADPSSMQDACHI